LEGYLSVIKTSCGVQVDLWICNNDQDLIH